MPVLSRRHTPADGTPFPIQNREMKARQSAKIREIGEALCAAGFVTLDKLAVALGLGRSTAWTVLRADHKASGLSAAVLQRMLAGPKLPDAVREKLRQYIAEKSASLHGHCANQRRRFLKALSADVVWTAQKHEARRALDRPPPAGIELHPKNTTNILMEP